MSSKFQIESIGYEIINQAVNLTEVERLKLYGFPDKYIAARRVGKGYELIMETIGKRDECARLLKKYLKENALEYI